MAIADCCMFALTEAFKPKPPDDNKSSSDESVMALDEWAENNENGALTELSFQLTSDIQDDIYNAKKTIRSKLANLYLKLNAFEDYGKNTIKEMKIHPDAFAQVVMQVAAYRTHGW